MLGALCPLLLTPSLGFNACLGLLAMLNLTTLAALWSPGAAAPASAA